MARRFGTASMARGRIPAHVRSARNRPATRTRAPPEHRTRGTAFYLCTFEPRYSRKSLIATPRIRNPTLLHRAMGGSDPIQFRPAERFTPFFSCLLALERDRD